MNDSILISIKKLLGIDSAYTHFDEDILIHINTVIVILRQMGVGPEDGYTVTDEYATWDDYLGSDCTYIGPVKSYMYLKVKSLFDPSASSSMSSAMDAMIAELEWRLNVEADV